MRQEILEFLAEMGPMTASEIALELNQNLGSVEHQLSILSNYDIIRSHGLGLYSITKEGWKFSDSD